MSNKTIIDVSKVSRRLADLFRIQGFQVLSRIKIHPFRKNAIVLTLRRLKKGAPALVVADYQNTVMISVPYWYDPLAHRALKCGLNTRNGG